MEGKYRGIIQDTNPEFSRRDSGKRKASDKVDAVLVVIRAWNFPTTIKEPYGLGELAS
jgi:hypothetical protein